MCSLYGYVFDFSLSTLHGIQMNHACSNGVQCKRGKKSHFFVQVFALRSGTVVLQSSLLFGTRSFILTIYINCRHRVILVVVFLCFICDVYVSIDTHSLLSVSLSLHLDE